MEQPGVQQVVGGLVEELVVLGIQYVDVLTGQVRIRRGEGPQHRTAA